MVTKKKLTDVCWRLTVNKVTARTVTAKTNLLP